MHEQISTRWHAAVVDATEGIGVGLASQMMCECPSCLAAWWADRRALDDELRVLGLAVVGILPADDEHAARFVIGRCEPTWDEDGSAVLPWPEDGLTAHEAGAPEVEGHPALPSLWSALGTLVEDLDGASM